MMRAAAPKIVIANPFGVDQPQISTRPSVLLDIFHFSFFIRLYEMWHFGIFLKVLEILSNTKIKLFFLFQEGLLPLNDNSPSQWLRRAKISR